MHHSFKLTQQLQTSNQSLGIFRNSLVWVCIFPATFDICNSAIQSHFASCFLCVILGNLQVGDRLHVWLTGRCVFDIFVFRKQRAEWFPALFCRSAVFHKVMELLDYAGKYSLKGTQSERAVGLKRWKCIIISFVCGLHLIAQSIFMQQNVLLLSFVCLFVDFFNSLLLLLLLLFVFFCRVFVFVFLLFLLLLFASILSSSGSRFALYRMKNRR